MKSGVTHAILGLSIFLIGQSVAVAQNPGPPQCDPGFQNRPVTVAATGFDTQDKHLAFSKADEQLGKEKDVRRRLLHSKCSEYGEEKDCKMHTFDMRWSYTVEGKIDTPDFTHTLTTKGFYSCSCPYEVKKIETPEIPD